jgi:hypothetical protein
MQKWFNLYKSINMIHYINRIKDKKLYEHLNRCKKVSQKWTFFHDKTLKFVVKWMYLNIINSIYEDPTINIILHRGSL